MKDNESKDTQVASKQAPGRITIATAVLSLISALMVAIIGLTGNIRIEEIRSQTTAAQGEVDRLNAAIKQAEVALEQRKFDAEQQARRDQVITTYVPRLLSSDQSEKQAAVAILFILYPNEAKDILARVAESLGEETAVALEETLKQATILDKKVGEWAIVIGSDTTLESAEYEATRAEEQGYTPLIYLKGDWFATTVGPFPTQTEAESVNIAVRSTIRESAFVVNLNSWCPQPIQKSGYYECPSQ